jgi:Lhr-like helicase
MGIKVIDKPHKAKDVERILHPFVREWFFGKFKEFSLPQLFGVMEIHKGNNVLISAPTGATKTLTAFLSIINELVTLDLNGALENKVYATYISPLKALSSDISVNLTTPLKEIGEIAEKHGKELSIRVGLRTGDTTPYERSKMSKNPPHIFVTTPESLAIVLTTMKFREHMRDIKYFIIDEIHALADNKRGVDLSLSLERLKDLGKKEFCKIGLSATVHPLKEIAQYLVGTKGSCRIVDVQFLKKMDLKVLSPVKDLINTTYKEQSKEMYALMDRLIQEHKTTLIFTNTRAATERVVHYLKETFPKKYNENIGAHHGSLSKEIRLDLENRLREGKLKCVVCSTSLELGLDIGYIDLVISLGSPKGVARFLQRCLPYNAEVLVSNGEYKKIGEIVEKKLNVDLISYDKNKGFVRNKIHQYQKNPHENLYSIEIKSGEVIKCTGNHPIMTKRGWIKVKNIVKEDFIATACDEIKFDSKEPYLYQLLPSEQVFVENEDNFYQKALDIVLGKLRLNLTEFSEEYDIPYSRLIDCRRKIGRRKSIRLDYFLKVCKLAGIEESQYLRFMKKLKSKSGFRLKLPLKLNSELSWLAGIIASDGCIVRSKDKRYITPYYKIKIGNNSEEMIEKCKRIFNSYGFKCHQYSRDGRFISLECGSKIISELMLSLGIKFKNKTRDVEVGAPIFRLNSELQHAYLEGIFEGDGNFNLKSGLIRIFTASPRFSQGIHKLFNRLGYSNNINKSLSKKSHLVTNLNFKNIYCISISGQEDVKKFLNNIPSYGVKARNSKRIINKMEMRGKKNLPQRDKFIHWIKVKNIIQEKYKNPVYNLTLENPNNNFIVGNIITHNSGRAGHKLHDTVKSRVIVLDRDDLIECAVMLKSAIERKIDTVHIPNNCLDVLAQQIYGIAIADRINYKDLFEIIKGSYCYKDLSKKDFDEVLNYLSGEFTSLEDRHVYAKIFWDKEYNEIGSRGSMARIMYMTNIGTIPDETGVKVKIGEQIVGSIDEGFLERLKRRDVFVLGGSRYEFQFARGMVAQVKATADRPPTIPSWFSEMLPLSFDLGLEIGRFRRLMEEKLKKRSKKEIMKFINEYLYVDKNGAEAVYRYFKEMFLYSKEIPSDKKILIEHYNAYNKKFVVFHTLYGRRVNDVLSRAVAYLVGLLGKRDVEIGINDNGFYLASDGNIQAKRAFDSLKSKDLDKIMEIALEKTEVLRRRFRHCAGRSLMILRTYKGRKKRVGRQQVSSMILINAVKRISNDFPILKETRREVLEDLMDVDNAREIVKGVEKGKIKIKEIDTKIPSPFAFNLVLQGQTDIFKVEEKAEFLQRMHQLVLAKIGQNGKID